MDPDWINRLSEKISLTLSEWNLVNNHEVVSMIAIDCHPWNGFLELCILTEAEVIEDELLFDSEEIADWKFFQFSKEIRGWKTSKELADQMISDYDDAQDKKKVAHSYLTACSKAITTDKVRNTIRSLKTAANFNVSVSNPDTGEEFIKR